MNLNILKPRLALNKAFLKVKPNRNEIELFKANLIKLLGKIDEIEREENQKNHLRDFLRDTFYKESHEINTKDSKDLVIHLGKSNKDKVGVIIEAKRPSNRSEMISAAKPNAKAIWELILYYFDERVKSDNNELKQLIITNVYEWYIFDANDFDKFIYRNTKIKKLYETYLSDKKDTQFFYEEVSKLLPQLESELNCAYFDIREYEKPLRNNDKNDDNILIALYKLLSPENLLKLPFANDSNSLDKTFYSELLHIIGLTETKDGSKKLIERKKDGERNSASLIESAIEQLDSLDKISMLPKPHQFGATNQERLFNVALELSITWINRILFLKLLEAQLIKYHKGNKEYSFLNLVKVKNFDDLNSLFFMVLARKPEDRKDSIKQIFANVPYLNSSLFEPTALEHSCLFISQLNDDNIPIFNSTVLKDTNGNKKSGAMPVIDYLFEFLEAYDFASEGSEDIQEDNKRLINASVLGLIFEKINGYKDGSFFTPGFITMYMCRETLRRAVLQKFNEAKNLNCADFHELYNEINDAKEANAIVNSLKICDPAVGSGHFLVSALNEIISIKSELGILIDRQGRKLRDYNIEVANDELVITDEDGKIFEYNPNLKESQRVQEALFHEKQTIIENCLFGVDINPNSVKICRLRLWIELLKNAYYKQDKNELETLPNIDINIKCGNSLISRYALDADIKAALKKSKWSIDSYKVAVMSYRNAQSKEEKRSMEKLIEQIKGDFESEVAANDKRVLKLSRVKNELISLTTQTTMFEMSKAEKAKWDKDVKAKTSEIDKLENELEEIKSNKIYENAFEWRFEFPEVLNDEGDFIGFDVVIGNPPYISLEKLKEMSAYFEKAELSTYSRKGDIYILFVEQGFNIAKAKGCISYIMPNKWMQAGYGRGIRRYFLNRELIRLIDFGDIQVFDGATTYPCIFIAQNNSAKPLLTVSILPTINLSDFYASVLNNEEKFELKDFNEETWVISSNKDKLLLKRLNEQFMPLNNYVNGEANYGIKFGLTEAFLIDNQKKLELINKDPNSEQLIGTILRGRNLTRYGIPSKENLDHILLVGFNRYNEIINNYPAIHQHLLQFEEKLKNRGQCTGSKMTDEKPFNGQHHWLELDNNPTKEYLRMYSEPKIMYQKFQVKPCFIYDEQGLYCNDSMWVIPSNDKALLAMLNSKMGWWLITKYCTQIQNGFQLIWKYFGQIPIPQQLKDSKELVDSVNQILTLKQADPQADTSALEKAIDSLVYELYGLTEEEIRVVEGE